MKRKPRVTSLGRPLPPLEGPVPIWSAFSSPDGKHETHFGPPNSKAGEVTVTLHIGAAFEEPPTPEAPWELLLRSGTNGRVLHRLPLPGPPKVPYAYLRSLFSMKGAPSIRSKGDDGNEVVLAAEEDCPRCGEAHENVTYQRFAKPLFEDEANPNDSITWWALCPETGEPLVLPEDAFNFDEELLS